MSSSSSTFWVERPRIALAGTVLALVSAAAFAHNPALWPGFVAASLVAAVGLVILWLDDALSLPVILAGAVVFRLAFAPVDPIFSDDVFRYVWDGRLQLHGINPYQFKPDDAALAEFQSGGLFEKLNSASYYSVYPPISQIAFLPGAWAFEWGGWTAAYFTTKALFMAAEALGLWILTRLTSARNVLLYAWNPLVLLEMAGQVHTEALLVPLLLGAVWAVRTRRGGVASVALAGATLVKLIPVVLGPFLIRRFGWRAVWPGALFGAALCLPYAAPYVLPHVKTSVDLYVRLFEFNAGPYLTAKHALWTLTGTDWSKTLGPALRWAFLASLPGLYLVDAWRNWSFRTAALVTFGLFFVFSTTVHPWYLLAVLPLAVIGIRPAWPWLWLGICSLGTYLFYTGAPAWPWIALGWGGAAVWGGIWLKKNVSTPLVARSVDRLLQRVQRHRAREKAQHVLDVLRQNEAQKHVLHQDRDSDREDDGSQDDVSPQPHTDRASSKERTVSGNGTPSPIGAPIQILDLGAGEGYVGAALQDMTGADVTLADVVDMNRTSLPHLTYDGVRLPLPEDAVDVVILYFVLHHCEQPDAVLREALRVARHDVVVVESVYDSALQHRLLNVLDPLANRLRSGGRMDDQEEHLHFRPADAWVRQAESLGARVHHVERHGSWIHPQATLRLRPEQNAVRAASY